MVVDGWCRLALPFCSDVCGWRRLATVGVGQAGARRGHMRAGVDLDECRGNAARQLIEERVGEPLERLAAMRP
jgi:hypothetical protein